MQFVAEAAYDYGPTIARAVEQIYSGSGPWHSLYQAGGRVWENAQQQLGEQWWVFKAKLHNAGYPIDNDRPEKLMPYARQSRFPNLSIRGRRQPYRPTRRSGSYSRGGRSSYIKRRRTKYRRGYTRKRSTPRYFFV